MYNSQNFLHYSSKLLFEIYYLDFETFKKNSIIKRATKDYCKDVVEIIDHSFAELLLNKYYIENDNRKKRFRKIFDLGLISLKIYKEIQYLNIIRNKIAHAQINDEIFFLIDRFVIISYFFFEYFSLLEYHNVHDEYEFPQREKISIDQDYLINKVDKQLIGEEQKKVILNKVKSININLYIEFNTKFNN